MYQCFIKGYSRIAILLTLILKTSIDIEDTNERISSNGDINIKNLSKAKINKKLIKFKKSDFVKAKIRFFYY